MEQSNTGAIYVFSRAGSTWAPHGRVSPPTPAANTYFGASVALTADGSQLVVGATGAMSSGTVYTFTREATSWTPRRYLTPSTINSGDAFGTSVAIATDAHTVVAGAPVEASAATGVGGDQTDNTAPNAGAAYVFTVAN